ncbi:MULTISPECIES: TIGR00375 family protein [Aeribacillus]|jgi:uncharacterized protein (TIGR00375 family)|uniref:TIGR00375 family protein n=1 Tax=Aeribacillus TaxID=1055323 RepID=UPI0010234C76|nr:MULTISPECIES: TIGR00375 family protein [Aeribacillus]MED1440475.1 TIGR00375 family protein [Aeribacillus composti]RZI51135.1 TIGR00375 family protein [Aeribacillus pallidus]BBU40095.1 hypothetical protein APP_23870 [Aeribacillus pallidus]
MNAFFADLHIHIGRTNTGKPVKITGAKSLTLENIFIEAAESKGMDIIGIIDCHVPEVIKEIEDGIRRGKYEELMEGGVRYQNSTLILGTELEIFDEHCNGPIHVLCFMPTLEKMKEFSHWLSSHLKNIHLSSQRVYVEGKRLQHKVKSLGGLFIPAHIFTPFKSLYGKGVQRSLTEVFDQTLIDAVELGLSSDTNMASRIRELASYPFLTNSDAHSLPKIGREYQKLLLKAPTFQELVMAIKKENDRKIEANYGLNPKLGKYYETFCEACQKTVGLTDEGCCQICGGVKITKGVKQRVEELGDKTNHVEKRPPYIHQVPLAFLPGIGPKTLKKLKHYFGTEMNILHKVPYADLVEVVPEKIAASIISAREGTLYVQSGGGGKYGKVEGA